MTDSRFIISLPFIVFAVVLLAAHTYLQIPIGWFVAYLFLSVPNLIIIMSSQKDKSQEEVEAVFRKADFSHLVKLRQRAS